ncbi:uncharacterized protein EDB91DRAFT_1080667 [Suillus paluster]|uniref:uncharacterized protein n=1 Tax=Suillus paluster TaxID=48578 RepID=UPI001B879686|nr:uncharacterized protein EDB91DRAFT_1080667 [Suillus paluster]KAG1744555.1 hypothetical protein EDB91DRAFT_1080667 [Suillus paluster]
MDVEGSEPSTYRTPRTWFWDPVSASGPCDVAKVRARVLQMQQYNQCKAMRKSEEATGEALCTKQTQTTLRYDGRTVELDRHWQGNRGHYREGMTVFLLYGETAGRARYHFASAVVKLLTGLHQISLPLQGCRAYEIYFSKPPGIKAPPGDEYTRSRWFSPTDGHAQLLTISFESLEDGKVGTLSRRFLDVSVLALASLPVLSSLDVKLCHLYHPLKMVTAFQTWNAEDFDLA